MADTGADSDTVVVYGTGNIVDGKDGANRYYINGNTTVITDGLDNSELNLSSSFNTAALGDGADRVHVYNNANQNFVDAGASMDLVLVLGGSDNVVDGGNDDDRLIQNGTGSGNILRGGAGNDELHVAAGAAATTLEGGAGIDRLTDLAGGSLLKGGLDDDSYTILADTQIVENANEGIDAVGFSTNIGSSYTLAANFETLFLYQAADTLMIEGHGNSEDNTIWGNRIDNLLSGGAGNDTLQGDLGSDVLMGGSGDDILIGDGSSGPSEPAYTFADQLMGGTGNDIYLITDNVDAITEAAGEGTDLVQSFLDYTLGDNLENLDILISVHGTGNALNNVITGNQGSNILDGGAGADTLKGGAWHDTYIVDNSGDKIIELATDYGIDMVLSSVSYGLANYVENLTLTGAVALTAAGNSLDNILTGNGLNNTLRGYNGNDTLYGLEGNDNLYGGNQNDMLYGGSGNDTLNGEAGSDRLEGGLGNDSYTVDSYDDYVVELADEGTDSVKTTLAAYDLGTYVENLSFTGAGNSIGRGNTFANVITGNDSLYGYNGNDTLNGGAGADYLEGGGDNDLYYVDSTGDVVVEHGDAAGGVDTVRASVDYVLAGSVEKLILTGTAIAGTGNTLNNTITGNAEDYILSGGLGADTLSGAAGNDTYLMSRGDGADRISDNSGDNDRIVFASDIAHDQLWFKAVGSSLEIRVIGTADKYTVLNWYTNDNNRVESIQAGSGKVLDAMSVEQLVAAMATLTPPAMGQLTLNTSQHVQLDGVIAAAWQNP